MAEDALKIHRSVKTKFTRKKNEFFKAIVEDKSTEILRAKFNELTEAWSTVEGKHDIYVMYLSGKRLRQVKNGLMNYKKNTMEHRRYTCSMKMKNN